ncbi:potassium transporter Kup [Candidatus Accumulibacter vicinus]|uniref:Probable potassium transport system protein Kup n=1 Tax=Candidatus Accumulibacter vicinus TaxID=2954382 RepID=A0A084Y413_9PROT|nr:potassium transporter Kup [Candidatus Accumulibacter vicinus]KFB69457.1 MAG: potassium transport protein Kup [Candidatus Accumulibacter vicinus]
MSSHVPSSRLAALSLAALGVVYGDIGTSPLYALKEVFGGAHHPVPITPDNVLGILSVVFWSLMVVVSLKYVIFILRADNKGEGGIMALMALALHPLQEDSWLRRFIIVIGLFGAALFYGDGVITPAISVLSAVEGLEVVTPTFKLYVLPISLVILVGLFLVQRRGTATVGTLFGPIMVFWFIVLGILGIASIVQNPQVLQALNPLYGVRFFANNPILGFFALGACVLALTGAEALYADMGHFGRRPIQLAWFGLVMPALLLNYFGQGALLLQDPTAIENPFYRLAPEWFLLPMVGLATMATVIASQAVISGAFSITQQAIQLGFAPRMEICHTSDEEKGQIYLPSINWTLLLAVIALVVGFHSSSNLAAAYGIAVTGTMFITDILAFMVARYLWGWPVWKAFLGALPFALIDIGFFSANTIKIADGGWFPLIFGLMVYLILSTWKRGRDLLKKRLMADAMDIDGFVNAIDDSITRVPGTAVFLTANPAIVPQAMLHSMKHYKALHERIVIVSVSIHDVPRLEDSKRVTMQPLKSHFWQVKLHYGFMERPNIPEALEWCAKSGLDFNPMETSFFLGRETLIPRISSEMCFWREKVFVAMFRNAGSAAQFFGLPPNRVVELGTQVVL